MEKHVSQFNPSLQLSTTKSLVHSTHTAPQLDGVRKLIGWDGNSLMEKKNNEKESNKKKEITPRKTTDAI